ncbi:MAG: diphthine synthase [Candidatus Marsarchaeota archaeon]|nr:diphthine synthase [Candidatus Marsarchaeota archaeon]
MLYLVGLGLGDADISEASKDVLKKCDVVMADGYTASISAKKMETVLSISSKEVEMLDRHAMEEGISKILDKASSSDVAIVTNGDPLIATTHKTILIEAKRRKIGFKVMHSTSIFSVAIAESGLDFYRFGPICTIARWSEHYKPVSFYETIAKNVSGNQHSLVLLDYDSVKNESMPIQEALGILSSAESHYKQGLITTDRKIGILCDLGTEKQRIEYSKFGKINKRLNYTMATLIFPSNPTDIEADYIKMYERE